MNRLAMIAVAASLTFVSLTASADPDLSIPGVGDVTVTHASVTGCSAAPGSNAPSLAAFVFGGLGLVGLVARRRRAIGKR